MVLSHQLLHSFTPCLAVFVFGKQIYLAISHCYSECAFGLWFLCVQQLAMSYLLQHLKGLLCAALSDFWPPLWSGENVENILIKTIICELTCPRSICQSYLPWCFPRQRLSVKFIRWCFFLISMPSRREEENVFLPSLCLLDARPGFKLVYALKGTLTILWTKSGKDQVWSKIEGNGFRHFC